MALEFGALLKGGMNSPHPQPLHLALSRRYRKTEAVEPKPHEEGQLRSWE